MPLRLIAFLISAVFAGFALAQEPKLKPFTATYAAKYSGIGVTATRELSGSGGNWRLDFNAHSLFADIREYSRFIAANNQLSPRHYEYHKTGLGKDRHTVLNFEQGRVVNVSDKSRTLENVPNHIQDKLSYQLQLALDVATGKETLSYKVADGKRIREYEFSVVGKELLQTPLGEIETIKVQRVRDGDSDRETSIWFAPKWDYALVKLMQEEDGKSYQISLTKLSIDGKNISAGQ
ncbi:DUF3108 domain-containing protein [Microbulbifer rhizosphaerae]|uniref:DUF3108 domain-containing protein n=1 Tax=Microbulbifer rhizosphaerae TaxID=1562603 RepID=A0A7W4Z9M0_9GAMM|nr:hypothetical protein [Microbulbifer rhizosphaerae]